MPEIQKLHEEYEAQEDSDVVILGNLQHRILEGKLLRKKSRRFWKKMDTRIQL
mgnify:CR=1 FL=1